MDYREILAKINDLRRQVEELARLDAGGVTDHGALSGLTDDDHTQYALLAGRSGGQTLTGGTASGDDLTLESTSHGTKGDIIIQSPVLLSPGGTQDYEIANSTTALVLQAMSAGQSSNLWLMANDGDATDNVAFRLWGKGTPASLTNVERLTIYWNIATSSYEILSEADGTGTLRALVLYTEGNTNQVNLSTAGRVGFGVAPTLATVEVSQTQTTGSALRVVRDLASASTDSPVASIVQDNTGDDQIALRVQQDGTGNIANLYDGATLVVQVIDGGNMGVGSAITTPGGVLHAGATAFTDTVLFERAGQTTDAFVASMRLLVTKTTNMADGFGPAITLAIQDDAGVINAIGAVGAIRAGGDTTGDVVLAPVVAGTTTRIMLVKATGGIEVLQPTLGGVVQKLYSTATNDDPTELVYQNRVTTTNGTTTTLHTFTIPASTTVGIQTTVVARRTGGSAGTAEDGGFFVDTAAIKNVSGTATVIASQQLANLQAGTWGGVSVDVTGATARVRVTGLANVNITWHMTARVYTVSS